MGWDFPLHKELSSSPTALVTAECNSAAPSAPERQVRPSDRCLGIIGAILVLSLKDLNYAATTSMLALCRVISRRQLLGIANWTYINLSLILSDFATDLRVWFM
jgi:hypothetical protein